jgi:hypothetical protein
MARRTVWSDLQDYLGDGDSRRGWALCAQDGIISTAGILLGFVGAGADEETLLVAGGKSASDPAPFLRLRKRLAGGVELIL